MDEAPPFVGQRLLDDLSAPQATNLTSTAAPWSFQLPARTIGGQFESPKQPAMPADAQQPVPKKPNLTSNVDHYPARLDNSSSLAKKTEAESNKAHKNPHRVRKKGRPARSAQSGPKKKHDYSVWQVPDVAFTQDNHASAPPANSADFWTDLKAKAQASRSKPAHAQDMEQVNLPDGLAKQTNASSNQTSSHLKPDDLPAKKARKPRHRNKAKAKANPPSTRRENGSRPQQNPPQPGDQHEELSNDSIAARIKLKHEQQRDADAFQRNLSSRASSRRAVNDPGNYEAQPVSSQTGDYYRPSPYHASKKISTDSYRPVSSHGRLNANPGELPPSDDRRLDTPIASSQPSDQPTSLSGVHLSANLQQPNQYYGLGDGIWPLQPTHHTMSAQNAPMPYDIGHAFSQMRLGEPPKQFPNAYATSNDLQNAYSSFTPLNRTSGVSTRNAPPVWNRPTARPNNFLSPHAPIFTQASAMHSSSVQNNAAKRRVQYSKAPHSSVPPKPADIRYGTVVPSIAPKPSDAYLKQASEDIYRQTSPQPLLIISDLNGTLISRNRNNPTSFKARPELSRFLAFLTNPTPNKTPTADAGAREFTFMVWTSARPNTTKRIVETLFTPQQRANIIAIWSRDTLGLNPEQYHGKTQVYKRLTSVWRDDAIQHTHPHYASGGRWSQRNTILIDDSVQKAASEPFNLVNVPELTPATVALEQAGAQDGSSAGVLQNVAEYIDKARWFGDVSSFIKVMPFSMTRGGNARMDVAAQRLPEGGDVKDDGDGSDDEDMVVAGAAGVPLDPVQRKDDVTMPGAKAQ